MQQIILTASSASELNVRIKNMIEQGWTPVGSHKVVSIYEKLTYAGFQHKHTTVQIEYSQTVKKD